MLGSKKRDYKTEARRVNNNLRMHNNRMRDLMAEGYSKELASKIAFDEMQTLKSKNRRCTFCGGRDLAIYQKVRDGSEVYICVTCRKS